MYWLNGALMPKGVAGIDPADRGFTLGDGLYETLAVVGGRPRHLARHLARLRAGRAVLALPCPWTDAEIEAGMAALIAATGMMDAALRLTLSRGPGSRGLPLPEIPRPTLCIGIGPRATDADPLRVVVAGGTRRNEFSPLSRIKSLNALDSVLARREAAMRGADEALLLNTRGRVAEASAAALFVRRGGRWLTPPVAEGALPGIARALLIGRAGVAEAELTPTDLEAAEAAILGNSLGLRPVGWLDERALPAPRDLERLRSALEDGACA